MSCTVVCNCAASLFRCYLQYKSAIQRVQALTDISRLALYAIAVYKAISLHTCMLS